MHVSYVCYKFNNFTLDTDIDTQKFSFFLTLLFYILVICLIAENYSLFIPSIYE